ncbi:hypothetical protein [Legionella gresilensis]|uniref:hypothetical protein n=1 Tax=Legionella gresilensis TaxID=91823 RepID=UPI001041AD44|nr:hypothetical protein [Legionella gresilensis]
MYKKTLTALFITSSLINPVFATKLFQKIITKQSTIKSTYLSNNKLATKQKNNSKSFTDFSGNWEGQCIENGETYDDTITIKNDKLSFTLDGEVFEFGALKTDANSNEKLTSFKHMLFEWDENYSRILMSFSIAAYIHMQEFNEKFTVYGYGGGEIFLKNNQLVIRVKQQSSMNENYDSECTYNKL